MLCSRGKQAFRSWAKVILESKYPSIQVSLLDCVLSFSYTLDACHAPISRFAAILPNVRHDDQVATIHFLHGWSVIQWAVVC